MVAQFPIHTKFSVIDLHPDYSEPVVRKTVHAGELFTRELDALSHHHSDHFPRLLGTNVENRELHLEYIDGSNVYTLIKQNPRGLSSDSVRNLTLSLAQALEHLHSNTVKPSFVHYDVSGYNVITRNDHVTLLDFGTSFRNGELPLTYSGDAIGTLAFVSPERAQDDDPQISPYFAHESDVYAMGCIAYLLETGTVPFDPKQVDFHDSLLHETPLSPLCSDPLLDDVIMSCLEKDPANRPSAGEVVYLLN